jgi:hypothetical protein
MEMGGRTDVAEAIYRTRLAAWLTAEGYPRAGQQQRALGQAALDRVAGGSVCDTPRLRA